MTQHVYLVPIIRIDLVGGSFYNVPKYFPHRFNPDVAPELVGVSYAWETLLEEGISMLVADVTDAQHTFIGTLADVFSFPDLDTTVQNALDRNAIRDFLETAYLPGNWVNVGTSYRAIAREILGVFQFFGRFKVLYYELTGLDMFFDGTHELGGTILTLPQNVIDTLAQAASDLGLDYSGITGTTTLRDALYQLGAQFTTFQFDIGGYPI